MSRDIDNEKADCLTNLSSVKDFIQSLIGNFFFQTSSAMLVTRSAVDIPVIKISYGALGWGVFAAAATSICDTICHRILKIRYQTTTTPETATVPELLSHNTKLSVLQWVAVVGHLINDGGDFSGSLALLLHLTPEEVIPYWAKLCVHFGTFGVGMALSLADGRTSKNAFIERNNRLQNQMTESSPLNVSTN